MSFSIRVITLLLYIEISFTRLQTRYRSTKSSVNLDLLERYILSVRLRLQGEEFLELQANRNQLHGEAREKLLY